MTSSIVDARDEVEAIIDLWSTRGPDPFSTPAVLLARFEGESCMMAFARPERPDDKGTDPVVEMGALLVAAMTSSNVTRATFAVPARMRDVRDDQVVVRSMAATWMERSGDDAQPWRMGATSTQWDQAGDRWFVAPESQPILVENSPVGSMLWDSTRTTGPGLLAHAIDAVRVWGFDVVHTHEDDLRRGTDTQADRTRHRMQRLARDLRQRHQPTAPAEVGERLRSPIPVDLPAGFVPACPF